MGYKPTSYKKGCTALFAVFAISAAAVYAWLRSVTPPHDWLLPAALAAASFFALAALAASMFFDALAERRLLREASSGALPKEGTWGVLIGTIHSDQSLTAPLSGEKVIAYSYRISQIKVTSSRRHSFTHAKGSARGRCELRTPYGSFPLLHAPVLWVPTRQVDVATASRNWENHVATARFEIFPDEAALAQPAHRVDERKFDEKLDWNRADWSEDRLFDGDEVTIYGSFSGGGIAADPDSGAPPAIYQTGKVSASIAEQMKQGISGVFVSLFLAFAIIAGYWFFVSRAPETTSDRPLPSASAPPVTPA